MPGRRLSVGQTVRVDNPSSVFGESIVVTVTALSTASLFPAFAYRTAKGKYGWTYTDRAQPV